MAASDVRPRLLSKLRRFAHRTRRNYHHRQLLLLSLFKPEFVRTPYGVEIKANWSDLTFRYCASGDYGFFLHDFLLAQDKPFSFLDIGANQGLYSMIASRNVRCQRIYAFEPVQPVADIMEENLRRNRCERVTLVRRAVSDRTGSLQIPFNAGHSGGSSLARGAPGPDGAGTVAIQMIDHAEISRIVETGGEPIIVKVDVEGHEPVVIAELMKCAIAPSIRAIFYECDDRWISAPDLRRMLEASGFDDFQKVGTGSHYDILATRREFAQPPTVN